MVFLRLVFIEGQRRCREKRIMTGRKERQRDSHADWQRKHLYKVYILLAELSDCQHGRKKKSTVGVIAAIHKPQLDSRHRRYS